MSFIPCRPPSTPRPIPQPDSFLFVFKKRILHLSFFIIPYSGVSDFFRFVSAVFASPSGFCERDTLIETIKRTCHSERFLRRNPQSSNWRLFRPGPLEYRTFQGRRTPGLAMIPGSCFRILFMPHVLARFMRHVFVLGFDFSVPSVISVVHQPPRVRSVGFTFLEPLVSLRNGAKSKRTHRSLHHGRRSAHCLPYSHFSTRQAAEAHRLRRAGERDAAKGRAARRS